jgi:hypothetical protein
MRQSIFARFMQTNGSIMGWRDQMSWLRVTRRDAQTIESLFGTRHVGRGGLRIASTVVSVDAMRRLRNAHASGGTAP